MPHTRDRRARTKKRSLPFRTDDFVCVAGKILHFAAETDRDPVNIDHFWITIDAGLGEGFQISINTASRSNRKAGFDDRLRVAIAPGRWEKLPKAGLTGHSHLDYDEMKTSSREPFNIYERPALEQLLADRATRAIFVEAWGDLYMRTHLGIHQIHSRRASCSVARDIVGRDGALRFYHADNISELLLFKFCGQP